MNRTFAGRSVLVSLVVVAVGLAALLWWLFASGRLDGPIAPSASKPPVPQTAARPSAPAPEKSASAAITEADKALKDLGGRLAPSPAASTDPAPAFDVARVAPDGEAVVAGRAVAGSTVELLADGEVHDRTTADASGAFVFVPKPLPPGNYEIKLRATTPDGKVMVSKSAVAVALRAKDGPPVTAQATPKAPALAPATTSKAPSVAALAPQTPAVPEASKPASKDAELRIEAIEPEAGGALFVAGRAAPGARVRLYMNDGFIAMATASTEGRVAFSIRSGVRPGDYRIRLEQVTETDRVMARVEKPFRAPSTIASSAPSATEQAPKSPATPDTVVASRQPEREAVPGPSAASPRAKPSVSEPAPAAATQQPAQESPNRSAEPERPSPPPVASAPQVKRESAQLAQGGAKPAAESNTVIARADNGAPATSQPVATVPDRPAVQPQAPGQSKPEPGSADNKSPRIARADRSDAVVIPKIDTRLIVRGDNLWRISEATYGLGQRYTVIFGANRDKIRDPDLIFPGQIFVLPKGSSKQ
jgi:nucleoid-associated protein YgaU